MKSSKTRDTIISIVGWYGAGAIISAYALVSFEIIDSSSWQYQVLNLTGALGIVIEAWHKKDRQPAVLNIFWAGIAAFALIHLAIA